MSLFALNFFFFIFCFTISIWYQCLVEPLKLNRSSSSDFSCFRYSFFILFNLNRPEETRMNCIDKFSFNQAELSSNRAVMPSVTASVLGIAALFTINGGQRTDLNRSSAHLAELVKVWSNCGVFPPRTTSAVSTGRPPPQMAFGTARSTLSFTEARSKLSFVAASGLFFSSANQSKNSTTAASTRRPCLPQVILGLLWFLQVLNRRATSIQLRACVCSFTSADQLKISMSFLSSSARAGHLRERPRVFKARSKLSLVATSIQLSTDLVNDSKPSLKQSSFEKFTGFSFLCCSLMVKEDDDDRLIGTVRLFNHLRPLLSDFKVSGRLRARGYSVMADYVSPEVLVEILSKLPVKSFLNFRYLSSNSRARSYSLHFVDEFECLFEVSESAYDLWIFLEVRFIKFRSSYGYNMRSTLHSLRKTATQIVYEFLASVKNVVDQLALAGSLEDKVGLVCLCGDLFDPFMATVELRAGHALYSERSQFNRLPSIPEHHFRHSVGSYINKPMDKASYFLPEKERSLDGCDSVLCITCEVIPTLHLEYHSYISTYAEKCDVEMLELITESLNPRIHASYDSPGSSRIQIFSPATTSDVCSSNVSKWRNKGVEGMFRDIHEMDTACIDVCFIMTGDADCRMFSNDFGKIPGLDIILVLGVYFYHTSSDTVERLIPGSIQVRRDNLLSLVKAFTNFSELHNVYEEVPAETAPIASLDEHPVFKLSKEELLSENLSCVEQIGYGYGDADLELLLLPFSLSRDGSVFECLLPCYTKELSLTSCQCEDVGYHVVWGHVLIKSVGF